MLTWRDVLTYVRLFLRWWFVLALAVGLSVGTAWFITRQQPDIFASQATLRVGNNFEVAAPSQTQVALSNVLADYYAALVKREVILGPVVERLQLGFSWVLIRDRMLAVRVDRGANLLEITVNDTSPERAAAIANAISEGLIAYTPNAPEKVAAQQAEIGRQIEDTQANIQAIEAKIAELEDHLASLSSAIDITDVQSQLDALQLTRQRYLDEYGNLLTLSNQTSANSLSFFEQARPAPEPLPKKRALTLAMAGAGGLLMAILAVLVLDRLDERWRTGSELQSRTGIKSLGDVPDGAPPRPGARPNGAARHHALSSVYSNMVLAAKSKLPRTLLISSPGASEARSALAIDIAEMYTRTGHRVLLVATEAGQSSLAGLFEHDAFMPPAVGRNDAEFDGAGSLWSYVRPTTIHNLLVLSGHEAGYDRFSSLVPLVFWPEMLAYLRKTADVVIFDGPSALGGPDAGLLAPMVDGVMLVLNGKQDSRSVAIKARKQLASEPESNFLGAVVTSRGARGKQEAAAPGAKGGGFQIAIGRKGITILLGEPPPAATPSSSGAGAHASTQRLLRSPTIEAEAVPAAAAPAGGHAGGDDESLTWDDLLELERGAAAPRVSAQAGPRQPGGAAAAPDDLDMKVIITPPPDAPAGGPGAAPQSAARAGRQRRARIANSRRATPASPPRPADHGADGV